MPSQRRWMRWIFEEAETNNVVLPWDRSARNSGWKNQIPLKTRKVAIPA